MNTDDLIYLIGELYVQRREQQAENEKLEKENLEKDLEIAKLRKQLKA